MHLNSNLQHVHIVLLTFLFLSLASLLVYQHPQSVSSIQQTAGHLLQLHDKIGHTSHREPPAIDHDARCAAFPDPGNIAIAVKTGATEAVEKIPLLMLTALQCAENVIVFSDLEQDIAGYHLYDALEDIPRTVMDNNSDFDFYHQLQEAQKLGQIESMLKDLRTSDAIDDLAAWRLDKYKQLYILEKLHAAHPGKDWYMMVDADTYIVWPNLLSWLTQLPNATENKMYLGSPAAVEEVQFAHGGSGILLSQAAMHELAVVNKGLAAEWIEPMRSICCGDLAIGTVLKELDILLGWSWPSVNGEKPATMPFGPTHWCEPVITMHHVTPSEMSQLDNHERSSNTTDAMTFSDLFHAFTKDSLPATLEQWDNYSWDVQKKLVFYEACKEACEDDPQCFQFSHQGRECSLGYSIHLGEPASGSGLRRQSGWLDHRIKSWVASQEPCRSVFPWSTLDE